MVDPISVLAALKTASDGAELLGLLKALIGRDEFDRLLAHLDSVFGETTGLSAAQLETWKRDRDFCAALLVLSHTADWESYRGELRTAVLGLTAARPREPREDELALADKVVREIEYFLPLAKQGDDVTRYVGRQIEITVERATSPLRDLDWAPERGRDLFDDLAAADPQEAADLQRALREKDLRHEIPGLIMSTPNWLASGSGLMWEVLAACAEGAGLWKEAVDAWDQAFDRPGSDRVRTRVRVATASCIAGDLERPDRAIAEAEEIGPTHPLVLFSRAERSADPEEALALLDQIEPAKDAHRAIRDLRRAVPLAQLGRIEEAEAAIVRARSEESAESELHEISAQVTVIRERPAWKAGKKTDVKALLEAAETFLRIRNKHRELGAFEGSVAFLSYAVNALLMADERGRALSLMAVDQLQEEELASAMNRNILAEQLLQAGRSDLAAQMLPELDAEDESSALIHAITLVQGDGEGDDLARSVAVLNAALAGDKKQAAAQARLIASLHHNVEWSEEAAGILEGIDPGLAAVMRAKWLEKQERWEEAENMLLPHFAEPRAQHALLQIAQARDEPDRIAIRAREILGQPSDHVVRLEAARALIPARHVSEAEAELGALAGAVEAPRDVRVDAFAELAELLTQEERYLELLTHSEQWLELAPENRSAAWCKVHCLFRLGRFEESLQFLDAEGLEPATLGRAQLAARVYSLALKGPVAVGRIVEIAEGIEGADEAIEALALFARLESIEEMPAELGERVNPERFLEAFPDSTLIQRFDAPETIEELVALLEEMGGDRRERIANATRSVFEEPVAPVGLIAIAAGQTVAETWRTLLQRPTGFGLAVLLDDERAFASNALTLGAVWDPGSLYLVEAIGGRLAEVVLRLLPKSVVSQSTLDDTLADSAGLRNLGERSTIGLDEERQPFMTEQSKEEAAEEGALIERVQKLVSGFVVAPDVMTSDTGAAAGSIRTFEDPRPQLLTFLGTLSSAERLGLPVFSADRLVRLTARRTGVRAFGVEAMIDALADRGEITPEERHAFRYRLRELNAIGTRVSADELAVDSRARDYRLTKSVAHALQDPAPIAAGLGEWHLTLLEFLRSVHEEAPASLDIWSARVIDALDQHLSLSPSQIGGRLLALSFKPGSEENRFTSALATSIISAVSFLGDRDAPVLAAARLLYRATVGELDWFTRGVIVARFADLMPPGHSFNARLVIFEDDGR